MKILLKNCRTPDGIKDILIQDDRIVKVQPSGKMNMAKGNLQKIYDLHKKLVIPGMIDPHVHVRDMEQAEKEDWNSASLAAINGGVTTLCDMPNTIPSTTNLQNLILKRKYAKHSLINYKFHLGATENNLRQLDLILKEKPQDIAGIKLFFAGSSSNQVVRNKAKIRQIFELAKQHDKVVMLHSEWQSCLDKWQKKIPVKEIFDHNNIRNRECAEKGTQLALEIASQVGNKLYICHVSTAEEILLIKKYKTEKIFCEVTPHHLLLEESILELIGNFGKVNPPLRTEEDNRELWKAVLDGTVDVIGSDHAPHTLDEKLESYENAPSGFPGLETTLLLIYTEFTKHDLPMKKMVELLSKNSARIFDLSQRGEIKPGYFADLVVIDEQIESSINATFFNSKAKYSPFDSREIKGRIEIVIVNGEIVLSNEQKELKRG